jgi:hypothetical protein
LFDIFVSGLIIFAADLLSVHESLSFQNNFSCRNSRKSGSDKLREYGGCSKESSMFLCVEELAFLEPSVDKDNACSNHVNNYMWMLLTDIPTSNDISEYSFSFHFAQCSILSLFTKVDRCPQCRSVIDTCVAIMIMFMSFLNLCFLHCRLAIHFFKHL